jgi:hypothetical protein
VVGGSALTILVWALILRCLRRRAMKKRTVRFATGKGMEMHDMEEVQQVGPSPAKAKSAGQRFVFRPPLTPGQPITPGAGARSEFPFPSSSEQRSAGISSFKGPVDRTPVAMTFDPPPRAPFAEGKPKGSRWR